ncbi:hypothetical protein HPP92_021705 [Vanilla planifolia]|uniref:SBP-type domain-containing protein n=1 Tax=Vanilla planifolia TaxID=51239 RepID=A0A835Q555_VANPL|nr:hypothetical protein HPP92_021705 [Vanilla planifolia]
MQEGPVRISGRHPPCQVDDCRADLSSAKDYHRRHKVCQLHSKASKAFVRKQIQRFCQQCSRFHLLSEFDEGKRSCRRRLAGHNRRRRKTQPDDLPSSSSPNQEEKSIGNGNGGLNLDIVNLLAKLANSHRIGREKLNFGPSFPGRDQLLQIVGKIQSLTGTYSMLKSPGLDLNLSQTSNQASSNPTCSSREDSSMALAAAPVVSDIDSVPCSLQLGRDDLGSQPLQLFPMVEVAEKTPLFGSQVELHKPQAGDGGQMLSLQLCSPESDNVVKNLSSPEKYFSDSSNPTTDTSQSSSPPVMHTFLKPNAETHNVKTGITSIHEEGDVCRREPLDLFQDTKLRGYASSSTSDNSSPISNPDTQERTGHIIFKLFDKDPSNFPGTLKSEILGWLSNRPSEMESYIRPGCVVLSVYLSMATEDWVELEKNFLHKVASLVYHSKSRFWANGRFLVRANGRIASHMDGKLRVWRALHAPKLISVSPVAIVSGQETTLVVRGRNLILPGTRIHCAYSGGYTSKKALTSTYMGVIYDGSLSFTLRIGSPDLMGRCFVEVENGFKGSSFPVIIANSRICQELRTLEEEFDTGKQPKEAVHFLNELGWLFQKTKGYSSVLRSSFSTSCFKFLFVFSVERDWLATVQTLLNLLVRQISEDQSLMLEIFEMLADVQLLGMAVKRRCMKMIDLLLHCSVQPSLGDPKIYLFPPNSSCPNGATTPLHLAASMTDAQGIVDALTSDPQEVGLSCWSSLKDENGQSPFLCASTWNNHSYNNLVSQKLQFKKNGHISIAVGFQSCSRCTALQNTSLRRSTHGNRLLRHPFAFPVLAIAAVCVCVCLFFRGLPQIENPGVGMLVPFKWENLEFGPK